MKACKSNNNRHQLRGQKLIKDDVICFFTTRNAGIFQKDLQDKVLNKYARINDLNVGTPSRSGLTSACVCVCVKMEILPQIAFIVALTQRICSGWFSRT